MTNSKRSVYKKQIRNTGPSFIDGN